MFIKKCKQCNKDFKTKNNKKKYCLSQCRYKYNANKYKKKPSTFNCKKCGKPNESYKTKKYCNDNCRVRYHIENMTQDQKNNKNKRQRNAYRARQECKKCSQCGYKVGEGEFLACLVDRLCGTCININ